MASPKVFALLVGIAKYDLFPEVTDLNGPNHDVHNIQHFLESRFNHYDLQIKKLTDTEATRSNVIKGFEKHLAQAGPGDYVLFYYSGHGSREKAPPELQGFNPAGMSETLLCYDSRRADGWDLADKELAYLLSQLDQKRGHCNGYFGLLSFRLGYPLDG